MLLFCNDLRQIKVRERAKRATAATGFLGEQFGVRSTKVWGMEISPFWRLTMALTIKEIENAKPKGKKYKMLDGAGLSLLVLPTGTKLWLWRYQFNGGEKNMTFGE